MNAIEASSMTLAAYFRTVGAKTKTAKEKAAIKHHQLKIEARKEKKAARDAAKERTQALGRTLVAEGTAVGEVVEGKTIKSLGRPFYNKLWRCNTQYAYF